MSKEKPTILCQGPSLLKQVLQIRILALVWAGGGGGVPVVVYVCSIITLST